MRFIAMSSAHRISGLLLAFGFALATASVLSAQTIDINEQKASDGYHLIARLNEYTVRLLDKEGQTAHTWTSDYPTSTVVKLQPDGTLMRTCGAGNTSIKAGGAGGRVELLDWDGGVVWAYELSTDTQVLHHDVKRLPNGNYLMLVWNKRTKEEAVAAGVDPAQVGGRGVLFERLIEVRPNYPSGGEIVWQWDLFDHIVQDRFPDKPNFGVISDHPELVNVHYNASESNPDWFHANAVDYNPALDQIVISSRNLSEVWIIDHSTTAEEAATHAGGRHGKGGDLLYRWGNPAVWSAGSDEDRKLGFQHDAHWIEPGLPGEGHLLIFNNSDPARPSESSVIELELPVNAAGAYDRADGAPYGPAEPVWTYGAAIPGEFTSAFISGAQRLPNGDTVICSGVQDRVFEVTPEGEVVWNYFDRSADDSPFVWLFRSYFYAPDYPGLLATPLYSNSFSLQTASPKP